MSNQSNNRLVEEWDNRKIQLCEYHHPQYGEGASKYSEDNCDICRSAIQIQNITAELKLMTAGRDAAVLAMCNH